MKSGIRATTIGRQNADDVFWFPAARWLLIVMLLAAPMAFGAVQPWVWGALELGAFLTFLLWVVGTAERGAFQVFWSPLYLPAVFFLLLAGIQLVFRLSLDQTSAREAFLKLSLGFLLFFLANQLLANGPPTMLRWFGLAALWFSFLLSMFSILQFLGSQNRIYWTISSSNVAFGPYVNRNHYAGLMEMLIPLAGAQAVSRRGNLPIRLSLGFMVLIPIVSVLISGSRGGWASLWGEALIVSSVTWSYLRRASVRVLGGALVAALATSALFYWLVTTEVSRRLAESVDQNEPGFATRIAVSKACLRMLRDHPWLGIGIGGFETVFPQYQSFASDLRWDHAHNDYLETLAETGLIGGLAMIAALVIFLRLAFKKMRSRLHHRSEWTRFGATVGCCGMLIHSLVDFNLRIPANAAWFVVCAAIAAGICAPASSPSACAPVSDLRRNQIIGVRL